MSTSTAMLTTRPPRRALGKLIGDSTRINATVTVLPNGFTLIFGPGRRVLARFTRALNQ